MTIPEILQDAIDATIIEIRETGDPGDRYTRGTEAALAFQRAKDLAMNAVENPTVIPDPDLVDAEPVDDGG